MKVDNGQYKFERRRKRFFAPIIYMLSEISLILILLSVANVSFDIYTWKKWSYIVLTIVSLYSAYKTYRVFDRQKDYEPA